MKRFNCYLREYNGAGYFEFQCHEIKCNFNEKRKCSILRVMEWMVKGEKPKKPKGSFGKPRVPAKFLQETGI